jgi:histone deacetylase 1/2
MRITHDLIAAYGMLDKMHIFVRSMRSIIKPINLYPIMQKPKRATSDTMAAFHTDEYIHFLSRVTPETHAELTYNQTRCESFMICYD